MIELWIDNRRCDIDKMPAIPINFDIANITKAEGAREGREIEIVLHATPANNAIFGASHDICASKRFNMEHHTAIIKKDYVTIFEGTAYLIATTSTRRDGSEYVIRINEGGAEWIENVVHGRLSDLEIPFAERLNLSTIIDSWEWDNAVRFLPVYRDNFQIHYSPSALPVERMLLTDDYHPFISVAEMVREMFAKSGYIVRSNFLESELGQSLYMSGDYSRSDNSVAKAKCDFFARRAENGVATASELGRVYASMSFANHSVGPIVDTANPSVLDSSGQPMIDTFCINNSFTKNSAGNICFTPLVSVKAGFLLHLEYSTQYKIISREKFCGFNKFEGPNGELVEIELANTCQDYRNNPESNWQYRAVIFNHIEDCEYKLVATFQDGSTEILHQWNTRSALITTPDKSIASVALFSRLSGVNYWSAHKQDWALYAGYIDEEGMIDVEMDYRVAPQNIAAGEAFVLDKFWFGGAEPGMQLIVSTKTSLRPYFTSVPGYNSMLEFKDVVPSHIRQVDLLNALGEMFNLAFYTDRTNKELFIEPLESFYENAEEVDWSNRIDHLGEISISDAGIDLPQNVTLTYINADYASHGFNNDNATTLGRWSFRNPLYGTKKTTKTIGNGLFTTGLNIDNILACAPSASILQVGDTGEGHNDFEASFTPRIVCYKGMRQLPEGEMWNSKMLLDKYPYAAFVDESDINLCFEDRNGIEGLHHYYLPMLHRQRDSRRLTLDLYVATAEIATLFTADGTKPSLWTKFRFNIKGESSLFRLAKIEKWDVEKSIVRCTFEQELKKNADV